MASWCGAAGAPPPSFSIKASDTAGEFDVSLYAFPERVMRLKVVDGVAKFLVRRASRCGGAVVRWCGVLVRWHGGAAAWWRGVLVCGCSCAVVFWCAVVRCGGVLALPWRAGAGATLCWCVRRVCWW